MQRPKKHYLLVDGYNIINAWDDLIELQKISLDTARDQLIDALAELASITGEKTILVFDSYRQKNPTRQHFTKKGIEIVYTKEFETADNYIESLVTNGTKHEIFKVASSDSTIQSMVFGKGASRISAQELKYYYENNREFAIKRVEKNKTKTSKNLVTLNQRSLDLIKKIEEQIKNSKS